MIRSRTSGLSKKVRQDKLREVRAGHDGTCGGAPCLVPVAKEIFDRYMPQPNQISAKREDVRVTRAISSASLKVRFPSMVCASTSTWASSIWESWLRNNGCVPILQSDGRCRTAEISRAQVWQWLRHGAQLDDGRKVTRELVSRTIAEEVSKLRQHLGAGPFDSGKFPAARNYSNK